jgi:hypothetical protein
MSTEENKLLGRRCFEEGFKNGNLAVGDEPGAEVEEVLERKVFGLALALATEPSKLGQLRQLLVQLQEQGGIALDFSTWALGQIDEQVLMQLLSFKGGSFDSLRRAIEDLYEHEQISGRVYAKARLLLSTNEPPKPA